MPAPPLTAESATICVVTVLNHEFMAAKWCLACSDDVQVRGHRQALIVAGLSGQVLARDGGTHVVLLIQLRQMGNTPAAAMATAVLHRCPNVQHVIMVGIAAAVPNPTDPEKHVRLGDVVISDSRGVVKFDAGKQTDGVFVCRDTPKAPHPQLVSAAQRLHRGTLEGARPWEDTIRSVGDAHGTDWHRPDASLDVLEDVPGTVTPHPAWNGRVADQPSIFLGAIGSGDAVVKDAKRRDDIRETHKVQAIEMEGAGIAEGCMYGDGGYIIIRGTCDYANQSKSDTWQKYAAVAAAAVCRTLIELLPTASPAPSPLALNAAVRIGDPPIPTSAQLLSTTPALPPFSAQVDSAITPNVVARVTRPAVSDNVPSAADPGSVRLPALQLDTVAQQLAATAAASQARLYCTSLELLDRQLEVEGAFRTCKEADEWLQRHDRLLEPPLAASLYEKLIRVAIRHATANARDGAAPNLLYAKELITRASNVPAR